MIRHYKTFVTWSSIIGLLMLPLSAEAVNNDEPVAAVQRSPEVMAVDTVLVRPLGLVSMVGGAVIFLVASPFSAMGGNTQETWDRLVADPAKFTFQRPLGHFDGGGEK